MQTYIIPSRTCQDSRRNIYLKDASGEQAIVTLWGEHAEAFDAALLHESSFQDSIVVLFVGMAIAQYLVWILSQESWPSRAHPKLAGMSIYQFQKCQTYRKDKVGKVKEIQELSQPRQRFMIWLRNQEMTLWPRTVSTIGKIINP